MFLKIEIKLLSLMVYSDLKVASSENFANYFSTTKAKNKCFIFLKMCLGLKKKYKQVCYVKSKLKALWHSKVDQ